MEEGAPIDWYAFRRARETGRIMDVLAKLPQESWAARDEAGCTLFHYACAGPNVAAVVALLQSKLVDMNMPDEDGWTPAHYAAFHSQPCALKLLITAGADLRAYDRNGLAPIDVALRAAPAVAVETMRVLVANRVRLSTARDYSCHRFSPKFELFERSMTRCRSAVVAVLRVKKAGELWRWDKFLLREIAYAAWATRYDEEWQN